MDLNTLRKELFEVMSNNLDAVVMYGGDLSSLSFFLWTCPVDELLGFKKQFLS